MLSVLCEFLDFIDIKNVEFPTNTFGVKLYFNLISAERARQRYQEPQPERSSRSPEPPHPVAHQVPSLLNLCMNHISQRLNDPVHQLRSLSGVAEDLAQKLLDYLLKNRLLKPKTLNAFIPW